MTKNVYFNDAIIGNGKVTVGLDRKGRILRAYFPTPDFKSQISDMYIAFKIYDEMEEEEYIHVCGEEYVVNKTNDELKFYNVGEKFQSSTNEYVDYEKEIYSYKKENIVGTEIEIRKYDPECFNEELFGVLQSREDIKEFLGFNYKDYNDFTKKAEIMNEQKEQNKNELEI